MGLNKKSKLYVGHLSVNITAKMGWKNKKIPNVQIFWVSKNILTSYWSKRISPSTFQFYKKKIAAIWMHTKCMHKLRKFLICKFPWLNPSYPQLNSICLWSAYALWFDSRVSSNSNQTWYITYGNWQYNLLCKTTNW